MKLFLLTSVLLATAQQVFCQSEPYLYVIYYEQEDCGSEAVSAIGFASDDDDELIGHTAGTGGLCATESLCLVDPNSKQCQSLEFTSRGETIFSIGESGLIFQCDSSNTDGECSFLDQCYLSSVYPNCHFVVVTTSAIVENPDLIRNTKTEGNSALDEHSYMVYYSDAECSQFEGMHGIVNGETNLTVTDESTSCRDAMACAFNPQGQACQRTGGAVETMRMLTGSPMNGEAVTCESEGNCQPVSHTTCMKSTIHPSCYYRMPTSAALFSDPEEFLTSYKLDASKGNDDTSDSEQDGSTSGVGSFCLNGLAGAMAALTLLL